MAATPFAAPIAAYGSPGHPVASSPSAGAPAPYSPAYTPGYTPPPPAYAPPAPVVSKGRTEAVAVVGEVMCPSCHMPTMATSGTASVCFSCGQPLDAARPAEGEKNAFPLTGAISSMLAPPANPYSAAGFRIRGEGGDFPVTEQESAVGRDPTRCRILLSEARVSGVHAYVKVEDGLVHVKDEGSNNGTFVDGARIAPHLWVPVRVGLELRFGPVAFKVMA